MSIAWVANDISFKIILPALLLNVLWVTACIMSHYHHYHKTSHHEVILSDGMSIAAILE